MLHFFVTIYKFQSDSVDAKFRITFARDIARNY